MSTALRAWLPVRWHRRTYTFTGAALGDLEIVMPPPYDLTETPIAAARAEVEQLLLRLQPGALDAGSRDVLNNWINARADQMIARLDAERDDRQAVGEVLIGLAREEAARRKPRYDADLAGVVLARQALETTFRELTGHPTPGPFAPLPRRLDDGPVATTLGKVDISDSWTDPAGDPRGGLSVDRLAGRTGRALNGQRHHGGDPVRQAHPDAEPSRGTAG